MFNVVCLFLYYNHVFAIFRQVKKKVEYLKFRARKEGFLLAGVAITGGNEPNKTYTNTSKGSSGRPKRKVAGKASYADTKSTNGPSSNSLSYLLRDLKERLNGFSYIM